MNQAALLDQQWSLSSMQIVNWGGFNGHKTIRFAPPGEATVISGKTGSGKSTLMDANTVLMQPGKRFNRASNDHTGPGRSLLSYMRGHLDKSYEKRLMLRGEDRPTWSAISQTWWCAEGARFTVFTAYYARPGDAKPIKRYGYHPGDFDLQHFAKYVGGDYANSPLRPQAIRADHPQIEFLSGPEAMRQWLFDQIGIPHAGKRLTDTLYRIQTSGPIGSVHQLFETLVLDEPETLIDLVNRSREQWTETQTSFREVADREKKAHLLDPIVGHWEKFEASREQGAFFDALFHSATPGNTPFWWWIRTRQVELLDAAEQDLSGQWRAAQGNAKAAKEAHEDARAAWREADRAFQAAGGGNVDEAKEKVRGAERRLANIQEDRRSLAADLGGALRLPRTADEVEQQRRDSNAFAATYEQAHAEAMKPVEEIGRRQYAAENRLSELKELRNYYAGRRDVIPPRHDQIRNDYAARSGIPATDLRFVGELLDMEAEWEAWRTAAELALGGFAHTLLIPEAHAGRFRETVDGIKTDVRIHSVVVPDKPQPVTPADGDRLAGRFTYREHRYSGWLSARLATQFNHVCVESGAALNRLAPGERGITIEGQVRDGQRGAHGGQQGRRPHIGFSPATVIRDLDAQIEEATSTATALARERSQAKDKADALQTLMRAHQAFLRAAQHWSRYDEEAATLEVTTLQGRVQALLADDRLARLEAEAERLSSAEQAASKKANLAESEATRLGREREAVMQRKDDAWQHRERMEASNVPVPDMDRLDAELREKFAVDTITVEHFNPRQAAELVEHLKWRKGMATREANNYRDRLAGIFEHYLREWPTIGFPKSGDPVDPDLYYEQFAEIRAHNSLVGLPEAKEKFAANVMRFTTMAASSVQDNYANAKREIEDRLGRINTLLDEQPFGPGGAHRLHIETLREAMPDETRDFLNALAGLGAYTTKGVGYDEMVERYERFEGFMDLVATDTDVQRLFDVRKHVYLHALETRPNSPEPITHDTFSEKSGGEYQELCAFVLAAAVRYQVGSEGERVPRFAPVFLDEGLIKADPEVTERAVNVWKNLGFQPIIAVPLDKHESVMVASSCAWTVSKDAKGRSRIDYAEKKGRE